MMTLPTDESDLELHLLQTFAGQQLLHSYLSVKHTTRVDDFMGIDAVAGVLMLATNRRASWRSRPREAAATRPGCKRFQALLLGEVPRMEQVLMDARRQAQEEELAKVGERRCPS
ncbi:hypothetical protein PF001_g5586 [Phytophthora fragariae]|uniref:Uncharacterized protein n=1 Tax=Phytophthora fragariae TaxID=53985 RepID=A0A6A4ECY2_9STRA|nr:hypothetical protein PF001_g5586 [Phytophthora fragariae]